MGQQPNVRVGFFSGLSAIDFVFGKGDDEKIEIPMKKTLLFSALALLLFACSSPDDSFQPKPAIFTKAVTIIYSATNIKINSAMVVAKILPNEVDAHAAFQMKENSKTNWSTYSLISTYSGKDTIKVTLDYYDLKTNNKYF